MSGRHIVVFAIIYILVGLVIAPGYQYTAEEQALVPPANRETGIRRAMSWPIRAYRHWQACGTFKSCEDVRCTTMEGGCERLAQKRRAAQEQIEKLLKQKMQKQTESSRQTYERLKETLDRLQPGQKGSPLDNIGKP